MFQIKSYHKCKSSCMIVRMQMSCHRLLQRGFAKLYGYSLTTDTSHEPHLARALLHEEFGDDPSYTLHFFQQFHHLHTGILFCYVI